VLTLAVASDSMPLSQVEDLVDTRFAPKISQISGVGLVSISEAKSPRSAFQANPTALSSYGINLEDLRTALTQTSNVNRGQRELRWTAAGFPESMPTINWSPAKDIRRLFVAYATARR